MGIRRDEKRRREEFQHSRPWLWGKQTKKNQHTHHHQKPTAIVFNPLVITTQRNKAHQLPDVKTIVPTYQVDLKTESCPNALRKYI